MEPLRDEWHRQLATLEESLNQIEAEVEAEVEASGASLKQDQEMVDQLYHKNTSLRHLVEFAEVSSKKCRRICAGKSRTG